MKTLPLAVKLPLLVIAAVLLTAGTTGFLAAWIGHRATEREAFADMRRDMEFYRAAVALFLDNARSHLESTAVLPGVMDPALWRVPLETRSGTVPGARWQAARLLRYSNSFEYIMLIGADGKIVLMEPAELETRLFRRDIGYASWFQRILQDRQTVLSDLQISPATRRPTAVVAVPVRDREGRFIGVWAGGLRLAALSKIGTSEGSRGAFGYVTDGRGLVVAHQVNPDYVQDQTDFSTVEPVRLALAGGEGAIRYTDPIEGGERLGAYGRVAGTTWAVVQAVPAEHAFAPVNAVVRWSLLALLAVATAMGVAGVAVTRRITRPLQQLTQAVQALGTGELDRRLDVQTGDEVGQLAEAFNRSTAALQEKDRQLRQRAAELETANRAERVPAKLTGGAVQTRSPAMRQTPTILLVEDDQADVDWNLHVLRRLSRILMLTARTEGDDRQADQQCGSFPYPALRPESRCARLRPPYPAPPRAPGGTDDGGAGPTSTRREVIRG